MATRIKKDVSSRLPLFPPTMGDMGAWNCMQLGTNGCLSMPRHNRNWVAVFWGKISQQNINPILEQCYVRGCLFAS